MNILENSYIITGPTASGKTNLAIKLAQHLKSEIICMDSMTLFKDMDIGTAKPTQDEQAIVKHHMVDVLTPTEPSSVQFWLKSAKEIALELIAKGKSPLFVGGTPLYLKALMMGLFEIPEIPKHIRSELEEQFPQTDFAEAYRMLKEIDADSAKKYIQTIDAESYGPWRFGKALELQLAPFKNNGKLQLTVLSTRIKFVAFGCNRPAINYMNESKIELNYC